MKGLIVIYALYLITVISDDRSDQDDSCTETCVCSPYKLGNDKCDDECDNCGCDYDHGDCHHLGSKDAIIIGLSIGGGVSLILSCIFIPKIYKLLRKRSSRVIMASIRNANPAHYRESLNTSNSSFMENFFNEDFIGKYIAKQYPAEDLKMKDNTLCTICFEGFGEGQAVRKTYCEHFFHTACLDEWIIHYKHMKCPNCNKEFKFSMQDYRIPMVRQSENYTS
ncbi:unnamed protein product [Blepharisma stoltei]|uniref:RING-type domain-containing protein n=1 Tax=Blepharisma stoltei TaxID=1481888 RepID=A0AAU9KBK5_9CILI|nr:unnamed protein product [Blepharisma stoltei]